ncbi:MAG: hypothetical protein R3B96_22205 [Pirellulaceae bacterium]
MDALSPNEILSTVTITVDLDPSVPFVAPSIDSPLTGTVFPPLPPAIRFSGFAEGAVHLVVIQHERQLMTQRIEVPKGQRSWTVDVPWIYGRGDYFALVFPIDPNRFDTLPSDATRFTVADDARNLPSPVWLDDPGSFVR